MDLKLVNAWKETPHFIHTVNMMVSLMTTPGIVGWEGKLFKVIVTLGGAD